LAGLGPFFGFGPPPTDQTKFTYYPGTENIGAGVIPPAYNRSFTIRADLEVPPAGAEGVIVAESDVMGGFSLYVQDGRLRYAYSFPGVDAEPWPATEDLPTGKVQVRYEFIADEPGKPATGGRGRLFIGDKPVGENHMRQSVPQRFTSYAGMD